MNNIAVNNLGKTLRFRQSPARKCIYKIRSYSHSDCSTDTRGSLPRTRSRPHTFGHFFWIRPHIRTRNYQTNWGKQRINCSCSSCQHIRPRLYTWIRLHGSPSNICTRIRQAYWGKHPLSSHICSICISHHWTCSYKSQTTRFENIRPSLYSNIFRIRKVLYVINFHWMN